MVKLLRDITGSVLVEYTIVFPVFILVLLGTVDVSYMLFEWGLANKAAYVGARKAIVSNSVASNITSPTFTAAQLQQLGQFCFNSTTGVSNGNCPSMSSVCSGGTCTNNGGWDEAAFTTILTAMQTVFPRIARQNVQITYQTNGLGFVSPGSTLPMNVTVSIQCMTHQFYFIDALMNWIFASPACNNTLQGPTMPTFASTLQSEDMVTN